uniref:Uncharacterized protein n=1 Tax=Tanacetum cinerariifolium TaxID=118510 RepID=A0A699J6W4_TANCI|nr:hypothetical protein [Tanacetum cinerariifolium]
MAEASLTQFELKKILLDKLGKSKSYGAVEEHKDLYDALVKSYQLDKDLFDSYGKMYSLKRGRKDKDKDEHPPARSDHGLKKRKTKEQVFETADIEMPQDQRDDMGNTVDQPTSSDLDQQMVKVGKPPTTFDELMSTPIDFSTYVLHYLEIENLTQEHPIGPAFNLFKRTCESRVELEFHFEECYKDVTDKLDWTNPEGHKYPFNLIKHIPLIKDQGRQVVPANFFFNNDLEYPKGGSLSSKYITSTTKTRLLSMILFKA